MYEEPVLRCEQCNKPFDKRELQLNSTNNYFVVPSLYLVLTVAFRVLAEETWVLLSVSKSQQHDPASILHFMCEKEGSLR